MEHWKNLSLQDIEGEIWKDIEKFESLYMVSNFTRIKSLERKIIHKNGMAYIKREHIKKQCVSTVGYLVVNLWKNNKGHTKTVHRLFAKAFISNPYNKPNINHKKGIKTDNRESQIEWATQQENIQHSYDVLKRTNGMNGKFGSLHHNAKPVIQLSLNGGFIKKWECAYSASRGLNVSVKHICSVCKNKYGRKSSHGFKWMYKSDYDKLLNNK